MPTENTATYLEMMEALREKLTGVGIDCREMKSLEPGVFEVKVMFGGDYDEEICS